MPADVAFDSAAPRAAKTRRRESEAAVMGATLPSLIVTSNRNDPSTLWEIDSTMHQRRNTPVSADSYMRLKHALTGGWVHSTQIMMDAVIKGKPNKKATMLKVVLTPHCDDNEAFGAVEAC